MVDISSGKRKTHQVTVKVDAELKRRIDEFAVMYSMDSSEAIRTLLSFAVMQNEDPKTRIMYALYNNLNMHCHRLLQDGLKAGMLNFSRLIQDTIGQVLADQEIHIPES